MGLPISPKFQNTLLCYLNLVANISDPSIYHVYINHKMALKVENFDRHNQNLVTF